MVDYYDSLDNLLVQDIISGFPVTGWMPDYSDPSTGNLVLLMVYALPLGATGKHTLS